jgi:asparagine synthase (glutamine-hydrolysing)
MEVDDVGRRFILVYNGELYNYRELREEHGGLGHRFNSQSDTEVLLTSSPICWSGRIE